jgi:hypothetical protein
MKREKCEQLFVPTMNIIIVEDSSPALLCPPLCVRPEQFNFLDHDESQNS